MNHFQYSQTFSPPAMVVPVVVASTDLPLVQEADALIDTGADASIIPVVLREALGLKPVGIITVRGARNERWGSVPIFQVRLRVVSGDWITTLAVEAVKPHVTLGRDIMNRFVLRADGPGGVV